MTRTLMQPHAAEAARHSRHFQLIVDIHLLLVSNGDLLLGRRANTGYGDGAYEPPSERLAERETLVEAAVRVAASQVGIALDPAEVSLAHVLHDVSGQGRMAFFLTADGWAGEACAVPPGPVPPGTVSSGPVSSGPGPALPGTGSYSDFGWYPLTDLPANMIDRARVAVRNYAAGARFSTYPAFGM
jgi:8-oxo-dGTP diphosphatase